MIPFQDITIIAALFNFSSMIGNLVWAWRLNSIKGNNELLSYWKAECEVKDNQLKELDRRLVAIVQKKAELKHQYQHMLVLNKKLEGELYAHKTGKLDNTS